MRRIHRSKGTGTIPGVSPETDLMSTTVSLLPDAIKADGMIGEPRSSVDHRALFFQNDALQLAAGAGVTDRADRTNSEEEYQ